MTWRFWKHWRHSERAEARLALERSRQDRGEVDKLVAEMAERKRANKFAPMLAQAFRERR